MTQKKRISRRSFLQRSAQVAGGLAVPLYIPSSAFGANERIVTGHIGVGGRGLGNLKSFLGHAAAVCDVDQNRLAKAAKLLESKDRKFDGYRDYRRILDRKDIDAVVISTPDHWHALPTVGACQAGKDVYCEKPLSLTIDDGRRMVLAARKYNRIVQTGSQQRSDEKFRLACELVRSGRIGKLQQVLVGINTPNHPGEPVPDSDPPAQLDYDFWLGPAPYRPYNEKRVHYNFRFYWDYSGGQMTNWGAHHIDIAQWGMGTDETGPVQIDGRGTFHPKGWHEVTETCFVRHTYANGVELVVGQGSPDIPKGTTFIGENGRQIFVDRKKLISTPLEIVKEPLGKDDVHLEVSKDHHQNFLDCVKSRRKPICDVAIGHRSATVCHLGNIAIRVGRTIRWDPENERILGDEEASRMIRRPYRSPWTI